MKVYFGTIYIYRGMGSEIIVLIGFWCLCEIFEMLNGFIKLLKISAVAWGDLDHNTRREGNAST